MYNAMRCLSVWQNSQDYPQSVPVEKRMAEMKKTDNEAIGKAYASKAAAYYGLKQDLQKIIPAEVQEKLNRAVSDVETCKILAENGIDVEMIEQMIADAGFDQIRIGLQEERDQELEMISAGFKLNDGVKLVCTCGAKDPEDFSYQFWCSSFDCGPDEGIFRCRKCNRYFKVDKDNNQTERD